MESAGAGTTVIESDISTCYLLRAVQLAGIPGVSFRRAWLATSVRAWQDAVSAQVALCRYCQRDGMRTCFTRCSSRYDDNQHFYVGLCAAARPRRLGGLLRCRVGARG